MLVSLKEFDLVNLLLMHLEILQNQLQVAPTSTTSNMSLQHFQIVLGISTCITYVEMNTKIRSHIK